jgi:hypothetical protein
MTSGTGVWIADNTDYISEDEPWEAYAVEWIAGPAESSMSGRLFGIKDGKPSPADFWRFSEYWDPADQSAKVQQYGWGSIGAGSLWKVGDETWTQQRFTDFEGGITHEGHRARFPDNDTFETWSFSIQPGNDWQPNRHYLWKRTPES